MNGEQLSLFETGLPLKDVALKFSVSEATVRNWIHEGILRANGNFLSQQEVENFVSNGFGKKLKSRANKTKKDSHCEVDLSNFVRESVKNMTLSGNELAVQYESALSESYKNKEGVYYTPEDIASDMLKSITNVENKTFLDPCCGSGNFLLAALEKGFKPENLYGFDTDANAIEITKRRIFEVSGVEPKNIICCDFFAWSKCQNVKFDYIFTNPPWGKKIPKQEKMKLAELFKAGNSSDTCALFFFASLSLLQQNGQLGLLLPEAFFNIGTFVDARKTLMLYKLLRLIDYGKPFKGLMTKAKAFVMEHTHALAENVECELYGKRTNLRTQSSFQGIPKHIINFNLTDEEARVIKQVYQKKHVTLRGHASWALGIVTGDNEKHCKSVQYAGYVPIYRGKDIFPDHVSEPELFINENLQFCQQVAPKSFYQASEKVIYRFISNRIVCFYDTQQRYILNSANLFILNENFKIPYQYIVDLLNSDFMNWLFSSLFCTHKILRGDLEELPIWTEYFEKHSSFDEKTLLAYLNIEKDYGTYRIKRAN